MQPVRTVGVLLAAGAGTRFDPANPGRKLDALVDGIAVAERSFNALSEAVDATVVATRGRDSLLARRARARGARVVAPADAGMGMGHSLAAAVTAARDAFPALQRIVVALADMPWVQAQTIARLVTAAEAADRIVQPRCNGERGHPVVFPLRCLEALAHCHGDVGARDVLRENAADVVLLDVDDRGVLRDVDTPGDLTG
jgi:molybdenum cofactor cytidylyltransferase